MVAGIRRQHPHGILHWKWGQGVQRGAGHPHLPLYEDVPIIQEIVRKLRAAGAISYEQHGCGIHIHVDASPFDARTLRNLTNIKYSKEDLIYKALQVDVEREDSYCRKVEERFLQELNAKKPQDLAGVERIWYDEASRSRNHSTNEKYTFRTWLLRLGMIGKKFEKPRKHLLEHLEGNIAWKDPAQAERQRERNRLRREQERALAAAPEPAHASQYREELQAGEVPKLPCLPTALF